MQDGGYDVADYRSIDPLFGSLEEAEKLIVEAHELGLRVIIDIVPNHGSVEHPWFREALLAGPGSTARERFHFRAGRGPSGDMPPNNWQSVFGGPAWSRTTSPEGRRGEWYLHLFAPGQPDLNWANPEVRAEFDSILRFWLDRGADGFRVDSATMLTKDPALPDHIVVTEHPGRRGAHLRVGGERGVDHLVEAGGVERAAQEVEIESGMHLFGPEVARQAVGVREPDLSHQHPLVRVRVEDGPPSPVDIVDVVAVHVGVALARAGPRFVVRECRVFGQHRRRVDAEAIGPPVEPKP